MNVTIQSLHFNADKKLQDFIEGRIAKLVQIHDGVIGAEVILRLEKSKEMDNKVAEIKIDVPGAELFAKKQCKTFEEATDTAVDALRKQLQKHSDKLKGK